MAKSRGNGGERTEMILTGRPVARGIGTGPAVCIHGTIRQFYQTEIPRSKIASEIERFQNAFDKSRRQIAELSRSGQRNGSDPTGDIFKVHLEILNDLALFSGIVREISENRLNAEWAVKTILEGYVAAYKALHESSLREKYLDLQDVGERILHALSGPASTTKAPKMGSVIIATELRPAMLMELAETSPSAIVTENGGWTSHTFIIARELRIPAVTGVRNALRLLSNEEEVYVNGFDGTVVINPTEKTHSALDKRADKKHTESASIPKNLKTLDGCEIFIHANSESPAGYRAAKLLGARGIGLYRSELLFGSVNESPSEEDQIKAYLAIAKAAGKDGVKIRTFDISGEGYFEAVGREKNPALGLRAIRFGLTNPKHLRTQIRAILVASHGFSVDIIVPMVSGVSDITQVTTMIAKEKRRLASKNIPFGEPRLGAMIEVPAAVITIEQIIKHVDFLCLGTNDLVQYMLAADRDNESVSRWFNSLHPAIVRSIHTVVAAADHAGKEIVACGEMAGSPFYLPVLLGLGVRRLSMNVNSIRKVRNLIAGVALEECRDLASAVMKCDTPEAGERLVRSAIEARWSHIFEA
ncbi:MAG: phosphoenolpyruvate--protein phosphotransferase [Pyrinomonadaceae bacterium]